MNDQETTLSAKANGTPDPLLTSEEVAQWLGIKKCTLEKARSMRLGDYPPFVRIGRAVRYVPADVKTWLDQRAFNVDGSPARPNVR
jgi:predicted DNA-binding transcriptional regulator AlpA